MEAATELLVVVHVHDVPRVATDHLHDLTTKFLHDAILHGNLLDQELCQLLSGNDAWFSLSLSSRG